MHEENDEEYYEIRKCCNMADPRKAHIHMSLQMLQDLIFKDLKRKNKKNNIYEFTVRY